MEGHSPILEMNEVWNEYKHLLDKMSMREFLWLTLFLNAYYNGDKESLSLLCDDELAVTMLSEANYRKNEQKRQPNESRVRKMRFAYTAGDYLKSEQSPEDALLDMLDSQSLKSALAALNGEAA